MPGGIGPLELVIVLVIVLVVFGPKRLPSLGRQLGAGMREFKDSVTGKDRDHDDDDDDARPTLSPSTSSTATAEPVADERSEEPQPRA
jgi:sec-independent protein translocase protein TatA